MSTMTMKSPNAPATRGQLFALFCATGLDTRGCTLTKAQAGNLIERSKADGAAAIESDLRSAGATGTLKEAKPKTDWESVWKEASEAGQKAGEACKPEPMIVEAHTNPLDDNSPVTEQYHVNEGVCGFAWVQFPGNSGFARFAKSKGIATKGHPSGLHIWCSLFGQSYERKMAWASAVASVLQKHGVKKCYAAGRLD